MGKSLASKTIETENLDKLVSESIEFLKEKFEQFGPIHPLRKVGAHSFPSPFFFPFPDRRLPPEPMIGCSFSGRACVSPAS